ncbi:MAG: hypothetical protein ACXVA2_15920 [Mucilaginibacter sp.]
MLIIKAIIRVINFLLTPAEIKETNADAINAIHRVAKQYPKQVFWDAIVISYYVNIHNGYSNDITAESVSNFFSRLDDYAQSQLENVNSHLEPLQITPIGKDSTGKVLIGTFLSFETKNNIVCLSQQDAFSELR